MGSGLAPGETCLRVILASTGVRPAFRKLQRLQAATTFSQVWPPFWRRGITWSRVKSWAFLPQYWQVNRSLRNTSFLDSFPGRNGRLTM